jgi:hypothetical protein
VPYRTALAGADKQIFRLKRRVRLDFLARTGAVISSEAAKAAESRNLAVPASQRQRPRRDFSTRFARSK